MSADLIVVLGGDAGARSLEGANLFHLGFAPRVLLTGLEGGETEIVPAYLHWRARILVARGGPENALLFDSESRNSWDEAINTLRLMENMGWKTALVVSDPPHMLRLEAVWKSVFRGSGLEFRLISAQPSWWDADHWWRNEVSGKFVINELIKLAYYSVKY